MTNEVLLPRAHLRNGKGEIFAHATCPQCGCGKWFCRYNGVGLDDPVCDRGHGFKFSEVTIYAGA
jgi:hypothetical protein